MGTRIRLWVRRKGAKTSTVATIRSIRDLERSLAELPDEARAGLVFRDARRRLVFRAGEITSAPASAAAERGPAGDRESAPTSSLATAAGAPFGDAPEHPVSLVPVVAENAASDVDPAPSCPGCGSSEVRPSRLRSPEGERVYRCTDCGERFNGGGDVVRARATMSQRFSRSRWAPRLRAAAPFLAAVLVALIVGTYLFLSARAAMAPQREDEVVGPGS